MAHTLSYMWSGEIVGVCILWEWYEIAERTREEPLKLVGGYHVKLNDEEERYSDTSANEWPC